MKILVWNARGVGNSKTQQQIWFTKNKEKVNFLAILKPMVDVNSFLYCSKFQFDACISNVNKIWLFHNLDWDVEVVLNHEQVLHCKVKTPECLNTFLISIVYAKCSRRERGDLWDSLRDVSPQDGPWVVGGDFNSISNSSEGEGGAPPDLNAMNDFNSCILDCNLLDIGFSGPLSPGKDQG